MKKKIMLLFLLVGVLATAAFSAQSALAQDVPQRIVLLAKRSNYTPGEITLKKGQPVILVLKSLDVAHGLRLRDFNINIKVKAGGATEVHFTPDKTGDFIGHCSVFCGSGHGGMVLKLHVVA